MTGPAAGRLLPEGLEADLERWLEAHHDELVAFRRHLRAHPELSFAEHATTAFIAERLEVAGLAPHVLSCGTGLWCDITGRHRGGPPGPAVEPPAVEPPAVEPPDAAARSDEGGPHRIALRADIDALAMDDEIEAPYRSTVPGVAHACGHDVHTTVVLGAGLFLHRWLARHPGPDVRLVFQPGEERVPGGALEVLADGVLDGVTTVYGLHCDPRLPAGRLGVRTGAITSAADMLEIVLSGPGGHTARPERTVDLVAVLARVAGELPGLVRSRTPAEHPLNLVFGAIGAGDAGNVIPTHGRLRGTARTTDRAVWATAPEVVAAVLDELVEGTGAEAELVYTRGIPPVVNHPAATDLLATAARSVLGPDAVTPTEQSAGGDDFAWYLERVAGSYARLGVAGPGPDDVPTERTWRENVRFPNVSTPRSPDGVAGGGRVLDLHAGHFDVDEQAIGVGVRVLVAACLAAGVVDPAGGDT